jgi:putative ABC transport system permease protein
VVTYRAHLADNERVVEGSFWPPTPAETAEVSIEEGLKSRAGLAVGDVVRFDILGRNVEATVTSIRKVEWTDARAGGFMFVFRPGVLERAPQTYIAPMRGPDAAQARARLTRDLTVRFPNVSVIDVREIVSAIEKVVATITLGIAVVGSLMLASGILILVGSISMTRFQRMYETAVLKTVGVPSRRLALMVLIEYGLLGLLAGAIGAVGAEVLSWAVGRYTLNVAWHPAPGLVVGGLVSSSLFVAAVGLAASLDVLRRKPLGTLRAE